VLIKEVIQGLLEQRLVGADLDMQQAENGDGSPSSWAKW